MQKKMHDFLISIGVSEPERFDLRFVLVSRNPYRNEQVDMAIEKSSPWDYSLLSEFQEACAGIKYPYTIRFSYDCVISPDDVSALFYDWHLTLYHQVPKFALRERDSESIEFVYPSSVEATHGQPIVADFRSYLEWLNYPYSVYERTEEEVKEELSPEPAPVLDEPVIEVEKPISRPDPHPNGKSFLEQIEGEGEAVKEPEPEEPEEEVVPEEPKEEPAPEIEQKPLEEAVFPVKEEIKAEEKKEDVPPVSEPEPVEEEIPMAAIEEEEPPLEELSSEPTVVDELPTLEPEEEEKEEAKEAEPKPEKELTAQELIDKTQKKVQADGEEYLIKLMEENLKRLEEDRNNKRIWKIGDYKPIDSIEAIYHMEMDNVDFVGNVFECDSRMSRNGKLILTMGVGDEDSAVNVRGFEGRMKAEIMRMVKAGMRVRVRGAINNDKFSGQRMIVAHFVDMLPPKELRGDEEEEKRVELHLHSKMSVMDGLGEMEDYAKLAKHMGMKALAVTDHGVVQSFPAAQAAAKKTGLKMIYGCELYMFDLEQKYIFNPCNTPLKSAKYCVFDTETTGLSSRYDRMVEFGGVVVEGGRVIKRFDTFINPEIDLSTAQEALAINHIAVSDLLVAPTIAEVMPKILEFIGDAILVAHNATFDIGFLDAALERLGMEPISNPVIDTIPISHFLFPEAGRHTEGSFLKNLKLNVYDESSAHRADYDANALNEGWQEVIIRLDKMKPGITHADLASLRIEPGDPNDPDKAHKEAMDLRFNAYCRHLREYHCVVLCKNQQGLSDLYRIVTEGHTTYLARVPKTPRQLIEEHRENFLVGSACFNGEIFEIASTRNLSVLADAMKFYDYIEIQPVENYSYLLNMGRIHSKEHLIEILRDIVTAAHMAGKPVVATGDVHYVNPEDRILRDVYIYAKGIGNGSHPLCPPARLRKKPFDNPPQHFRSTREMLDSFEQWMEKDEARDIVIHNSNLIADQISSDIIPVSDDLFAPDANLPHSDVLLRELCEKNFEERYGGSQNPEVQARVAEVKARLDKELNGIIGHGYSVTYYIAHKLIQMANDEPEHYIVGSRGSVGSSFAATMADITEVNPLPPHYHCPHCHYFEWGDAKTYKSGFDLPNKKCPDCGADLIQNGQNIPFETFLGFAADKVPDIDLNFEDESQHKAHNYTKILLGEKNVFRAGTIETVAEKTAFGYVRGYFEQVHILEGMSKEQATAEVDKMNNTYISYLASRCQGVKRTTGQHPGGIVVVPADHSLYDFTAVQHPADDLKSEWLTTHYDFHSMHDEILKFDILGHVDPMAMRYYRDLTGVKIEDIPMNDPRVLSLFTSPKELKLRENYLELRTGAAALPEFGTDLAQRMLETTKPSHFNDLLILSGLAHGTDVWSGNAEDLIVSGKTDINGVIGCRDDIMTYLISMGLPNQMSFKIMEGVRKGRGLTEEQEAAMRANHVPDFYINSAKKIKYLFPRGHATAYVMMAVRVAYFKLYYPLEFYAVFFSIRSDDWDIKSMIEGEEAIKRRIGELRARRDDRNNPLKPKEENILKTLLIALEMVERGYKFANIDLYKSDAKMFVVDHENKSLIPPFSVIDGLGVAAAQSIVDARNDGRKFLSEEDILHRATKLNKTNLEDLKKLGVLEGIGEKNQMSLFEFM